MRVDRTFKRTCVLDDGTKVAVRCIRPTDREALRATFHALKPETRYRRFMGHFADLTPAMVTYLTEVDGQDHVAIVAVPAGPQKRGVAEEIVAVARVIRMRTDRSSAEVAITVSDPLQGLGLGTQLLAILVEAAKERGIDTLVAHVLDGNPPMKRLLEKSGALTSTKEGGVSVTIKRRSARDAALRALAWFRWPRRAA